MASSNQLALPVWHLPTPRVTAAQVRFSDIRIVDAIVPLVPFDNRRLVYLGLLRAGLGTADRNCPYRYPQIGYEHLSQLICDRTGVFIDKDGIRDAIKHLRKINYVQRPIEAHSGTVSASYAVLTFDGVMQMFGDAGCEYFRLLRGKNFQLIRPI